MAKPTAEEPVVNARILYWGIPGAGISANLRAIHTRLKASNRGEIRRVTTRIDPSVEYEVLPIELGRVNGHPTQLLVIGAPGAREQAPTRMQLLDRIDGIVFVSDGRPECLEANIASLQELTEFLSSYGPSPSDIPLVIQYNKCDLVDPYAIERLHREVQLPGAAVFEASALDGTGILKTLTTISKQVIRSLGKRKEQVEPDSNPIAEATPSLAPSAETPLAPASVPKQSIPAQSVPPLTMPISLESEPEPQSHAALGDDEEAWPAVPVPETPSSSQSTTQSLSLMESAILAEAVDDAEADAAASTALQAQELLGRPWEAIVEESKPNEGAHIGADLRIVSTGVAQRKGDRTVSIPLVLGNDAGESVTLNLTLQLDPLLDNDS